MLLRYLNKIINLIYFKIAYSLSWLVCFLKFKFNGVDFSLDFRAKGVPMVNVNLKGKMKIGSNFRFNSGLRHNMIGRQQKCFFIVGENAELTIGSNVGISGVAFICRKKITIGNNVRMGGNVVIYDTDFHSLNLNERIAVPEDKSKIACKPVEIKDGAFIGAHSTILKGVTVGFNSIIGAGSVVVKSVPDNEIWGGNPAGFIRSV